MVWDKTKASVFKAAINENPIPEINRETSVKTVNSVYEALMSTLLKDANNTLKSFCITCKTKNKTGIPKPWFDDLCKELRKQYKLAKNKFKRTKNTADLVYMRNSSKTYKRHILEATLSIIDVPKHIEYET